MNDYLVIARKYRPQQFDEIICQEHVSTTLTNAIKTNRVAHAYLFCGSKGIGKTTIARILAKALNCEKGPTPTPCGKCTPCQEITRGMSMDVLEIDGASNRGIDEIRELRDNVKFAASGNRFKIYIIDEVHMLTKEAFNALLKTLEEPPSHVKFFFATTDPDKVPATILSRCQRFDLIRIPNDLIVKRLQHIGRREKINIPDVTLYTIARCANGSMRDAESILDKLIAYSGTDISHKDALAVLGVVDQEILHDISLAVSNSDTEKAIALTTKIFEQGKDLNQFILDLTAHFRNILLAKYSQDTRKLIELPEDEIKQISELAKNFTQSQLLEIINSLTQLHGEIKWSLSKRITLEMGIIKISRTKHKISLDQLIDRLEQLENNAGEEPKLSSPVVKEISARASALPVTKKEEEPPTVREPLHSRKTTDLDQINQFWQEILAALGKRNPLLKSYLSEGVPIEIKNNLLTIAFDPSCTLHQESLEKQGNKSLIEQHLSDRHGVPIKIKFIVKDIPAAKAVKKDTLTNPSLEKVRQTFGAKIINIKAA